jgi:hypothetical protein
VRVFNKQVFREVYKRVEYYTFSTTKLTNGTYYAGQKFLAIIVCQFKKKNSNPYFIVIVISDYRLDYERYFLSGKFQNSKLFYYFDYTERLPQVIYVQFL